MVLGFRVPFGVELQVSSLSWEWKTVFRGALALTGLRRLIFCSFSCRVSSVSCTVAVRLMLIVFSRTPTIV